MIHLPMGRFAEAEGDRPGRALPGERRQLLRDRLDLPGRRRPLRRVRHARVGCPGASQGNTDLAVVVALTRSELARRPTRSRIGDPLRNAVAAIAPAASAARGPSSTTKLIDGSDPASPVDGTVTSWTVGRPDGSFAFRSCARSSAVSYDRARRATIERHLRRSTRRLSPPQPTNLDRGRWRPDRARRWRRHQPRATRPRDRASCLELPGHGRADRTPSAVHARAPRTTTSFNATISLRAWCRRASSGRSQADRQRRSRRLRTARSARSSSRQRQRAKRKKAKFVRCDAASPPAPLVSDIDPIDRGSARSRRKRSTAGRLSARPPMNAARRRPRSPAGCGVRLVARAVQRT